MPLIDVVMPIRNALPYLDASLSSVVSQTESDWRLLALDHGSTDGSRELLLQAAARDSRIIYVDVSDAAGLSEVLNRGLALAEAKYIMRQDADDISLPQRMKTALAQFAHDPQALVVGGQAEFIDTNDRHLGATNLPTSAKAVQARMLYQNVVFHPAATLNWQVLRSRDVRYGCDFTHILPLDRRMHVSGLAEDYFLFGQLALQGHCVNSSSIVIRYRLHAGSEGASRRHQQLAMAGRISAYLAECLQLAAGCARYEVGPYLTHDESLAGTDMTGGDLVLNFDVMRRCLIANWGTSSELDRELAYRRAIGAPGLMGALRGYAGFAARFGVTRAEFAPLRNTCTAKFRRGIRRIRMA